MLQIKNFSNDFSVSPQIWLDDLPIIVKLGYKSIINNRPDGEDSEQASNLSFEKNVWILIFSINIYPLFLVK